MTNKEGTMRPTPNAQRPTPNAQRPTFFVALKRFISLHFPFIRTYYRLTKQLLVRIGLLPFNINFVVLSVGQACNYHCIDCGNLAPYAPAKFRRYDLEDITKELSQLFNAVDNISNLQIQGGEPFLYSELGKVIEFVHKSGKVKQITIATNGTIIPSDELLNIMKKANVCVRISDYNITPNKARSLSDLLKSKGIQQYFYWFARGKGDWYFTGGKNFPREDNDEVVSKRFFSCAFMYCLTLEHGQIARCSRGNDAPEIQGFDTREGDYVVFSNYKGKALRRALAKYYFVPHHMEACRYCNGTDPNDVIPAAIQG